MKALSKGEEAFALHCRAERLEPVREFRFHPERKWRFDFCFPEEKVAVEIEGLSRHGSRHATFSGYREDCRKYAEAVLLGWRVFRVTTEMVISGEAIDYVLKVLPRRNSISIHRN